MNPMESFQGRRRQLNVAQEARSDGMDVDLVINSEDAWCSLQNSGDGWPLVSVTE
jgi:hypothetical protein